MMLFSWHEWNSFVYPVITGNTNSFYEIYKILTKIFFSGNAEWSSKKLWKVISDDVKTNVNHWGIKELVALHY